MKHAGFPGILIAWVLLFSLYLLHSCNHEGMPADQMDQVCFTTQVLPIFQNSCATTDCHDAATAENNYIFTDYANIMKSITPGNASKSTAYQAMTSHSEIMPPGNPLPIDKRILVRVWIEQGAKESTCEASASTLLPNSKKSLLPAGYSGKSHSAQNQHMASFSVSGKPATKVH